VKCFIMCILKHKTKLINQSNTTEIYMYLFVDNSTADLSSLPGQHRLISRTVWLG